MAEAIVNLETNNEENHQSNGKRIDTKTVQSLNNPRTV
jgi:hypothetical protein